MQPTPIKPVTEALTAIYTPDIAEERARNMLAALQGCPAPEAWDTALKVVAYKERRGDLLQGVSQHEIEVAAANALWASITTLSSELGRLPVMLALGVPYDVLVARRAA